MQIDLQGKPIPIHPKPNVIEHYIIPEQWVEEDSTTHNQLNHYCPKPKNFDNKGQCRECWLGLSERTDGELDRYCTLIETKLRINE